MKTVDSYNFEDKKALVRVDFNVPLNAEYSITDDTRIKAAIPTIKKILADGGSIILMSHLGRPKPNSLDTDFYEERFSLKHIVNHLSKVLETTVAFSDNCIGETTLTTANNLQEGDVLLLENLRFHAEEKMGDIL